MDKFDFSGWATRANLKCSDGRVIMKDAFKHNDGQTVPLVWNHQHSDPLNVLGHALLENRDEGVYAYCSFNETESGQQAKLLVQHGDISHLSIFANQLRQQGSNVQHGMIREVSLVLAGANPGAFIESVISHGESSEEEAVIFHSDTDEDIVLNEELSHTDDSEETEVETEEDTDLSHADEGETKSEESKGTDDEDSDDETLEDTFNTLNEKQKKAVYYIVGKLTEGDGQSESKESENIKHSEGGDEIMKENVFDKNTQKENVLSHSDMENILKDAKRCGSLKDAYLAHAESTGVEIADKTQTYGINGTDWLFPEARTLNNVPEFIKRDTGWVKKVMAAVHKTPFSRIKSMFADITEEDARAKGYIKGKLKKEEVFGLLKRTTTPTTIYKKQKMDRDDIIDITDFDVVAWIKGEMRLMLDEEIARALLVGDGRSNSSDDKINELNIRPIWTDEDLFTIKALIDLKADATADEKAKAFIRKAIKARKNYKGSGSPVLYTTEDMLTDCLLLEDATGRIIYDTIEKLKNALRVSDIITVPVMEGLTRTNESGETLYLDGIIVNLNDYNVGADKGGAINMFEDFDIDYNQEKYLIETRCSGALIKPYSAIVLESKVAVTEG